MEGIGTEEVLLGGAGRGVCSGSIPEILKSRSNNADYPTVTLTIPKDVFLHTRKRVTLTPTSQQPSRPEKLLLARRQPPLLTTSAT